MAQLVVAAAGAALGGILAPGVVAFGLTGASIGWTVGSLVGGALFNKSNVQGPRLNDLKVSGTEYGQVIPWVTGKPRIAGQIVWASPLRELANTQKVGKGGSQKVTTYTYEVDLLILLTENEVAAIGRIWSNGELVYDGNNSKDGVWTGILGYLGTEDQLPDPTYEAAVGVGNAPAYRGRAYVMIQGLQLGQSGQIPNLTFELNQSAPRYPGSDSVMAVACAQFVSGGTGPQDIFDPANTTLPDYENRFGEFGDTGLFKFQDFTTAPSDTGSVGSVTLPITVANQYRIFATDGYVPADVCSYQVEFLNSTGGLVAVVFKDESLGEPTLAHQMFYGLTRGSAVGAPLPGVSAPNTDGYFDFESGLLRWTPFSANSNQAWTLACDARSIRSVRLSNFRARATSTGSGSYAMALFQKLGLPGAPGVTTSNSCYETVVALMERAGYQSDEYDATPLVVYEKPVRGFAISQPGSTRQALEVLQSAFFFEAAVSDKIYFFPRAETPVVTIPYDDLRTTDNPESDDEPLLLDLANEVERPAQIALSYPNVLADYHTATEFSDRLESSQESTSQVQIPMGMTQAEAKAVADALLFDQEASRIKTSISVGPKYARLEPGDVINVENKDGRLLRMRVGSKDDTFPSFSFELTLDDVGALTSSGVTSDDYTVVDEVRLLADTLYAALDIPLLRDADDQPGFYASVGADRVNADDEWPGAVFARAFSVNAFENEFLSGENGIIGEVENLLGDFTGGNEYDETNLITVLVNGELSSTTWSGLLADASINAAAVGVDGRWEVLRFRTATLVEAVGAKNRYTLSGLLRGRKGTEHNMGNHDIGDRFVLLDSALRNVEDQLTQIGVLSTVKGVTLNKVLSDVPGEEFTDTGVRLKPLSPVQGNALASASGLEVTWSRRTRLSYRYGGTAGILVPLGEETEAYRVRIYDGLTLVRTATTTSPAYTYASADISADGFSPGDPVTIVVDQLSARIGYGYPTTINGIAP